MDMNDFERLLEAKIDPITKAIEKLELQQEKIVSLMERQAILTTSLANLQDNFRRSSEDNVKIHDMLFNKARILDEKLDSKITVIDDKVDEIKRESGNKLWDIVKIVAAGAFGGAVAWLAGNK